MVAGKAVVEKKVAAPVTNGPKAAKPKPEIKKVGRPAGALAAAKPNQTAAKPTSVNKKPTVAAAEGKKVTAAAAVTTAAAAAASKAVVVNVAKTAVNNKLPDLAARRVSTRGKKPGSYLLLELFLWGGGQGKHVNSCY